MVKKTKEAAKAKKPARQPVAKAKKQGQKPLAKAPAEYVFWCCDGSTFSDLNELAVGLMAMTNETFAYHSNREKHDFSNWVRDIIRDEELAEELYMATDRLEAAACAAQRLKLLTGL
jgi:spermidine synthase